LRNLAIKEQQELKDHHQEEVRQLEAKIQGLVFRFLHTLNVFT
jgi:hypothetical protein